MDENERRRTLFALLVVYGIAILSFAVISIGSVLISFIIGIIWGGDVVIPSLNFEIILDLIPTGGDILLLILKFLTFTMLNALFFSLSSPSDEQDRAMELVVGGIVAVIILIPLIFSLLVIFSFVLYRSYIDIEAPFEKITDSRMAEIVESQSSQIRSFTFNSVIISLAAIAFLFSQIENPSSDPSLSSFILSILFLFVSILTSEYTLRYKILVEYQSSLFIFGILFLFLGIIRSIGQFTGLGVGGLEIIFLLVIAFWSVGGQDQRNTHRIVSGEDPRLDSDFN